jgi:ribosomal protein S18 acetylase RimI-like enzyme
MENSNMVIRTCLKEDMEAIVKLWQDCNLVVPWNDPREDILIKLKFQPDLFLVGTIDRKLVATAMVGYEGHRGWVNYLAVAPDYQTKGVGRRLMKEAESVLKALGCPKLNVQVRTTNTEVIEFYKRVGFSDDNVIGLGKHL